MPHTTDAVTTVALPTTAVLLLAPSHGLGGGIERYVSTIEAAFARHDVRYRRLDLLGTGRPQGMRAKVRFVREVRRVMRTIDDPVRLVLAHRNLLPVVSAVARLPNFAGATVILHGCEIWAGRRLRGRRAMRRRDVRVVTASNFSAGALVRTSPANVLHPGLSSAWYDALVDAGTRARRDPDRVSIVTAFRLSDWRGKGLDTLLEAVCLLADDRIELTICGSGPVPPELGATVSAHPWCRIAVGLTDQALADQFAHADVFVLATRTQSGASAGGEGFGLVLLEAQVAGTPVVAPAFGGCGDAYQFDLTGLAPTDESPESLAEVLATLLRDEGRRYEMAVAAAAWARARFEPGAHARHVVRTLLPSTSGPRARLPHQPSLLEKP